jgi:Peptidase S24-like
MPYTMETREHSKVSLVAETLRNCGTVRLKAWGTSMLPSVWPGDLLTIQSVAHDEVIDGDIVLVLRDQRFLIHRLIERRQDQSCISWITRGDAVLRDDPPAGTSDLLGRVTGIQRGDVILIPSRKVSRLHSLAMWVLCRSGRFRDLTLRVHAARVQVGSLRAGRRFRGVLRTIRGVASASSHTSRL